MGLRCKNCGSTNTVIVPKSKLEEVSPNIGTTGLIMLPPWWFFWKFLKRLFTKEDEYVVCCKCGQYDKL